MIDHVSVGVRDLERAKAFYDALLAPLGYARVWDTEDGAGYGPPTVNNEPFAVKHDPDRTNVPQRFHLAFTAHSRQAVRAFHAAALEHGAADDGAPGTHAEYGADYFAAFVIDPDGYRLEAVFHEPATDLRELQDGDFDSMAMLEDVDPLVVQHVRQIAQRLHAEQCTYSWAMLSGNERVGLCGFKTPPRSGEVEMGYGVWPKHQRRGHATRAVARALEIARRDPRIRFVTAQTVISNTASQRVLEANGFERAGIRNDPDDGELLLWKRPVKRLSTPRLVLRPLEPADAAGVFESCITPASAAEASRYVETELQAMDAGKCLAWAILLAGSEQLIGATDLRIADETGDIRFAIGRPWRGNGYAAEAADAAIAFARTALGLQRVTGTCDRENERSAGVFQRLGFHEAGRKEGALHFELALHES